MEHLIGIVQGIEGICGNKHERQVEKAARDGDGGIRSYQPSAMVASTGDYGAVGPGNGSRDYGFMPEKFRILRQKNDLQ